MMLRSLTFDYGEFDAPGLDPGEAHLARVVEYDVPVRAGNGTGELIVVLSNTLDPAHARADELPRALGEGTSNDQLKTYLRGPGKILCSRLPELVHQEIWHGYWSTSPTRQRGPDFAVCPRARRHRLAA